MPLVVLCGYPCSGKTRRAHELRDYFTQNTERKVHVVGDEDQGIDKNSVYSGENRDAKCVDVWTTLETQYYTYITEIGTI